MKQLNKFRKRILRITLLLLISGSNSFAQKCVSAFVASTDTLYAKFINGSVVTGPVHYLWDFGDGQTSTLKDPDHTYSKKGIYKSCLIIYDSTTCRDTSCLTLDIKDCTARSNFDFKVDSVDKYFYWLSDYSNCGSHPCSYLWDFGDNTTSAVQHFPTHYYTGSGPYYVCLTVTNNAKGCFDTYCDSLYFGRSSTNLILAMTKVTGIDEFENSVSTFGNYPNPFTGNTSINYVIARTTNVELAIIDLYGNLLETIESGNKSMGNYTVVWNAKNITKGMYLLQLKSNDQILTRKIVVTQ